MPSSPLFADARYPQLIVLGGLLCYGLTFLQFDVPWWHPPVVLGGSLLTQYIGCRVVGSPFDWRSPLITGLSLSLLLRTQAPWLSLLAAVVAIGSKFVIRVRGKHVFNPANIGIVTLLLFGGAWLSPGQWGSVTWFALLMVSLGGMVVTRASRWDVSLAFLGSYAAILIGRALWLGDPLAIPLHQLQSGAVLLFAFFMISDPRTTPDHPWGRMLFAVAVAMIGASIQFGLYKPRGIFYALAVVSMAVPLLDLLFRKERYQWRSPVCSSV